jgi:hypothetical protein
LAFDFGSLTVSGIEIAGIRISESMSFRPGVVPPFQLVTAVNFTVFNAVRVSTSLTTTPLRIGGLALSGDLAGARLSARFGTDFSFSSAAISYRSVLSVGALTMTLSTSASFLADKGLSSVSTSLFMTQGTFTGTYSFAYTRQNVGTDINGDPIFGLKFSRQSARLAFRFAPAVLTISTTFGLSGLSQLAISIGIVF